MGKKKPAPPTCGKWVTMEIGGGPVSQRCKLPKDHSGPCDGRYLEELSNADLRRRERTAKVETAATDGRPGMAKVESVVQKRQARWDWLSHDGLYGILRITLASGEVQLYLCQQLTLKTWTMTHLEPQRMDSRFVKVGDKSWCPCDAFQLEHRCTHVDALEAVLAVGRE